MSAIGGKVVTSGGGTSRGTGVVVSTSRTKVGSIIIDGADALGGFGSEIGKGT